jgi:SAM-dependent methyltransferase
MLGPSFQHTATESDSSARAPRRRIAQRAIDWLMTPNRWRAKALAEWIAPWLPAGAHVIDIGSGHGYVTGALRTAGFNVAPVDIIDRAFAHSGSPRQFDGSVLPYARRTFDAALLITVLHHTQRPEQLLSEAARVASRVIVIEDLVETRTERLLTQLGDSWLNWQWRNHPHNNHSDAGWREIFASLSLGVLHNAHRPHVFWPWRFRHGLYVLSV